MGTPSWAILATAWLFALAILSKILSFQKHHPKLAPGPKPWPIIGNLNLIGPLPHQSLHKLSQKYGPIMQLKFGSYPVVIVSSSEMAKQFLKTHDRIFACRPQTAAGKYITYNYENITWAPYGSYWRQGRKIFLTELFSSKRLESYEHIRVEERRESMSRLYAISAGKPFVLKEHLSRFTLSILSRMVLGKKYFCESKFENSIVTLEEFQEILDEVFLLNGVLNIGDWIPWLQFLDLQGYVKRMKALKKKLDRFYDHVLDEHRAKKETEKDFVPKDMVDLLLQLSDDPNLDVKLNYNSVKGFTQDLIAGGTDTSATTVEWAMSELLKQPHLIAMATEELDRVIGRDR
ncbi:Cytochrome P450 [Quillaja saponaria]|uniref:Cytochrome P450 n=1 Tax=Quillaja saponaria TaxID=32244 RepID=A0AAD7PI51_QUISA|nr:Cytochrome P450 [Quillaja saponaria]